MFLLASLDVVSDSVLKPVLPWVKVRILSFLLGLNFLQDFPLLLLGQFFPVDTRVFLLDCGEAGRICLLLLCTPILCRLLLQLRRFHIVFRLVKVKFNVRVDTTDLIIWPALDNVDRVVSPSVLDINGVSLVKH